jgi:hypothetical protein
MEKMSNLGQGFSQRWRSPLPRLPSSRFAPKRIYAVVQSPPTACQKFFANTAAVCEKNSPNKREPLTNEKNAAAFDLGLRRFPTNYIVPLNHSRHSHPRGPIFIAALHTHNLPLRAHKHFCPMRQLRRKSHRNV